jgi:hypothetical protein
VWACCDNPCCYGGSGPFDGLGHGPRRHLDRNRDQRGSDGSAFRTWPAASCYRDYRYVGLDGAVVHMHAFGSSAPLQDVKNRFGFTPQASSSIAKQRLAERDRRAGR